MTDPASAPIPNPSTHIRTCIWIFLTSSVLYVGLTRGHFIGTDEIAVYQTTRSLWERGDFSTGRILNTFPGRDSLFYSQYSPGQSIAAVPLYGMGKLTERFLDGSGLDGWKSALAGPSIGEEPSRWGGDVEIFFVNLFNAFTTALLCVVFFVFNLRLGVRTKWAFLTTVLLGTTSYVAPFSSGFLQHSSVALFLLWAFYLLFRDARRPDPSSRIWAGLGLGIMLLFRLPSAIGIPTLSLYLIWNVGRRRPSSLSWSTYLPDAARQVLPFFLLILGAIAVHFGINYVKFATAWAPYNNEGFHTPLYKGLYAFLLSPGDSIFLYTPLLLLLPWTLPRFLNKYRAEGVVILGLSLTYLIFYAKYTAWHGLWSALGPRYLVPIVPLLLLPLGFWMNRLERRSFLAVVPLAALGLWMQTIHFSVNFAFVYFREHYLDFHPQFDFLFIPDLSPILAHSRALLSGDYRVDMWLVNVYRNQGPGVFAAFLVCLLLLFGVGLWRLRSALREESHAGISKRIEGPYHPRLLIRCMVGLLMLTVVLRAIDTGQAAPSVAGQEPNRYSTAKTLAKRRARQGEPEASLRYVDELLSIDRQRALHDIPAISDVYYRGPDLYDDGVRFYEGLAVRLPRTWWVFENLARLASLSGDSLLERRSRSVAERLRGIDSNPVSAKP